MVVSSYSAFKLWQVTVGFPFVLLAWFYKTYLSCLNLFRERMEEQAADKVCKNVCREIASPNPTSLGHSEEFLPCGSCGVLLRNRVVPCCAELSSSKHAGIDSERAQCVQHLCLLSSTSTLIFIFGNLWDTRKYLTRNLLFHFSLS